MEPISDEQKLGFANSSFPGKTVNLGNGDWWFIQAGNILGDNLHYEYWDGQVSLHIEGPNWRPLRNYLWREVSDSRVVSKEWGRQGCCWTLQRTPSSWEEIQEAFLELNRIMLPHILDFEAEQGFDKIYECEEMDVSAHKIKIDDLLHSENLHIPEYQRPYRWTTKNVEQLLQDVNIARISGKLDYLIGSVILHRNISNKNVCINDIVDGQQRITTIMLIIKALDMCVEIPPLTYGHSDSYRHIQENFKFIQEWFDFNLSGSERKDFGNYLLTNCRVVRISVKRLPEAFQLFETQNGRGKELEAYNLLKAYHIRAMADAPKKDKIECDVRWEDAALFIDMDGARKDLLRQVINEHLFRIRKWSREGYASTFSKHEIGEFKGLTLGRDNNLEYAYQNILVQQQIALSFMQSMNSGLFKVRYRFEHGDPDNISPFASINQLLVNGRPFFEYIETYVEIYKRLFLNSNSSQLYRFKDFYHEYCKYRGSRRKGDTYIRQVYKSAIILIFDRFGEKGVDSLFEAVYACLYRIRLEKQKIFLNTMCGKGESGWLFTAIQNAKNLSDFSVIKSRAEEFKRNLRVNFEVDEVKSFFKNK